MRKIAISAGHSPKEPGAAGNGYKEELLAIELRDLIVAELKALGVSPIVDSNENALKASIAFFKNLLAIDSLVIDLHWNASLSTQANGTEVLVPGEYNAFEYDLACAVSGTITNILNTKPRGINGVKTELESHHGRLGWMRLNGNNILIEVCFISNPLDMEKYQKNKLSLAKQLALTFKKYSEK